MEFPVSEPPLPESVCRAEGIQEKITAIGWKAKQAIQPMIGHYFREKLDVYKSIVPLEQAEAEWERQCAESYERARGPLELMIEACIEYRFREISRDVLQAELESQVKNMCGRGVSAHDAEKFSQTAIALADEAIAGTLSSERWTASVRSLEDRRATSNLRIVK